MTVCIIQMNIEWGKIHDNLRHVGQLIDNNPGADLYVLPEMFSTGFNVNPHGTVDEDGVSLEWMKTKSLKCKAALCGSVAVRVNDEYYNRLYFVTPEGNAFEYDKRHLFTYGDEHLRYARGEKRVVVEWNETRILLQTCYDLRFPVFSRNRNDYDMAIYVASWPERRHDVWTTLLKARALENQCYVVGVNRTGDDPHCHYKGGSVVINPYGKQIAECLDDAESVSMANIDIQKLNDFRNKFPVLLDADKFRLVL